MQQNPFLILLFYSVSLSVSVSSAQAAHPDNSELLQLSVLLEVMAEGLLNADQKEQASLATLEIGGHADLTKRISLDVIFAYSDESDHLEFDTLVLSYQHEQHPEWFLSMGQDYLPFGAFATHQVDDTFSLEIAESRQLFTGITHQKNGFITELYSHKPEQGSDTSFGAGIAYQADVSTTSSYQVGIDYIDSLYEHKGLSLQGQVNWQAIAVILERLMLEGDNHKTFARYTNQVELVYEAESYLVSISYQESHDLDEFELAANKISITISSDLTEYFHTGLQLARADNEDSASLLLAFAWE